MTPSGHIRQSLEYMVIVVVTFVVMQTVVVIMHEFTHSTVAWLLGHMENPLDIIWGNCLTLRGWDEGVHYSELFAAGHFMSAAIIGVSPLILHAAIVTLGLVVMGKGMPENKWVFHALFWFVMANFMELIAYLTMGAFMFHGDTGIFNRGMKLSPWFLFIAGSAAITAGLYVLFGTIMPRMYASFACGNRPAEWMILFLTAFALFLWGSGMRFVYYLYPDPQWMLGLLGFGAFGLVMFLFNPSRVRENRIISQ